VPKPGPKVLCFEYGTIEIQTTISNLLLLQQQQQQRLLLLLLLLHVLPSTTTATTTTSFDYYSGWCCRELEEESGVIASSLCQIGLLVFEFIGEAQLMEVHVYSTSDFTGTITESEGTAHHHSHWSYLHCSLVTYYFMILVGHNAGLVCLFLCLSMLYWAISSLCLVPEWLID